MTITETDTTAGTKPHRTETWRSVLGYAQSYEVSNQGRVRRADTRRILALGQTRKGYLRIHLSKRGDRRTKLVHRLVLEAFVGPCPDGMEGCHSNGDATDNRLENLHWGTSSENNLDLVRHGRHHNARKTHCSNGHPFSLENTFRRPDGGRGCRTCRSNSARACKNRNRLWIGGPQQ